jgi:hypothetical protein
MIVLESPHITGSSVSVGVMAANAVSKGADIGDGVLEDSGRERPFLPLVSSPEMRFASEPRWIIAASTGKALAFDQ